MKNNNEIQYHELPGVKVPAMIPVNDHTTKPGGILMVQEAVRQNQKKHESANYHRTKMKKEMVLQKLKEQGCRITKQRLMLLDIILNEDCSCCKEIYYRAARQDPRIGSATVYRMVNTLEEIGAISRKNMYKISCGSACELEDACTIEMDNGTVHHLSAKAWNAVITAGLKAEGYIRGERIKTVEVQSCGCDS